MNMDTNKGRKTSTCMKLVKMVTSFANLPTVARKLLFGQKKKLHSLYLICLRQWD